MTRGTPGRAPATSSSMLGKLAAVMAMVSPSQPRPAVTHTTCTASTMPHRHTSESNFPQRPLLDTVKCGAESCSHFPDRERLEENGACPRLDGLRHIRRSVRRHDDDRDRPRLVDGIEGSEEFPASDP